MNWEKPNNANQLIRDAFIRHQIYLIRHSGSWGKRIRKFLKKSEREILQSIDEYNPVTGGGYKSARARALLNAIQKLRSDNWEKVFKDFQKQAKELLAYEYEFTRRVIDSSFPVVLDTITPPIETLGVSLEKKNLVSASLKEWENSLKKSDIKRIRSIVIQGISEGLTTPEIGRKLQTMAYPATERESKMLARTVTNYLSNSSRKEFIKKNSEIWEKVRFVATLDGRTTLICASLDGTLFTIDDAPKLPLHYGERSTLVPVVNPDLDLVNRPSVPAAERGMLRSFCQKNKIDPVTQRKNLPQGFKSKYDEFRREYLHSVIRPIPGKTSYNDWLKGQSFEFQIDVLGSKRARLFRDGKLPLDRFTDASGSVYTLGQLKARESAAFKRAGLQ